MSFTELLRQARIVPVMVIRDVAYAVPLARALSDGGLKALEITLRSDAALESIHRIANEVPDVEVGAGTVLNTVDLEKAKAAGAKFIVSPGLTSGIAQAARDNDIPLLAGVATATDIMRGLDEGLSLFKFFPAETSGGAPALKAFAGPFPQVRFCPTGGITPVNLSNYLTLSNVVAAGGSWMIPADFLPERDGARVTSLAKDAMALTQRHS